MINGKIGWNFPPSYGGLEAGYNDSGIATFKGSPFPSLARETIQNSLDASQDNDKPVHVSFELVSVPKEDIGADELSAVIEACLEEIDEDDPVARPELERSKVILKDDVIPCLVISDRNTTGLKGELWRSLVKMQGVSLKPNKQGAGGSHGIGKSAPFVVSSLRTVFYWTCYKEGDKLDERFQGKSVLMSHNSENGRTQGIGFYGLKDGCRDIKGKDDIVDCFRVLGPDRLPVEGTSLLVAGFKSTKDWRHQIAKGVVENFFYAIAKGNLTVLIEPDQDTTSDDLEIDKDSLPNWLEKLDEESEDNTLRDSIIRQTKDFWNLINDADLVPIEKQDNTFGHCKLLIQVARGLPSRVGFVRRSGMLITTEQKNLKRFPRYEDFIALCVFEDPDGNELLRLMENPQHDQFEPSRLPEADQQRGRRGLNHITKWIRERIKEMAGPSTGGEVTVLRELSALLPDDIYHDEEFDYPQDAEDGNREPGFGERFVVRLQPIQRTIPQALVEEDEDIETTGEDEGKTGGGEDEGNGGEGEGHGRGSGKGNSGGRGKRPFPISGVRILPIEGTDNRILKFVAEDYGVVNLLLEEAGDSSVIPRDDIRVAGGPPLSDLKEEMVKGKEYRFELTSHESMDGRAWRLIAFARSEDEI